MCTIIVNRKHSLAQTTLSGTVVDAENNEAIPGANITMAQTLGQLLILMVNLH